MDSTQKEINHQMVDTLAENMKARLDELEDAGRDGWYDPLDCYIDTLFDRFNRAIDKTDENFLDIAILAGMLLWRKEKYPEFFPLVRQEFYIHKKSGERYEAISDTRVQIGNTWIPAIVYRRKDGVEFVRLKSDFAQAFEKVTK